MYPLPSAPYCSFQTVDTRPLVIEAPFDLLISATVPSLRRNNTLLLDWLFRLQLLSIADTSSAIVLVQIPGETHIRQQQGQYTI